MDSKIKCTKQTVVNRVVVDDSSMELPTVSTDSVVILTSQYHPKVTDSMSKNKTKMFKLPSRSFYSHLNESILYHDHDYDHASHDNSALDRYKDKCVLLISCCGIERMGPLKSLLRLKLKHLVCLSRQQEWANDYVDGWIYAEHIDVNFRLATLDAIRAYESQNNMRFDAVLTYDDLACQMTSFVQTQLGLNHSLIPYDFLERIKNKYEFRRLCESLDISYPPYFIIKYDCFSSYLNEYASKEECDFIKKLDKSSSQVTCKFPLVVKNPYGFNKDYVKKCLSMSEFCESLRYLLANDWHIDLVVEEFYDGHEIDMDILIQNNELKFIVISDNFEPIEPWFFETGGIMPSFYLSPTEQLAIEIIVTEWISKMNFQNGIIHFEARCKPKSLYTLLENRNDSTQNQIIDVNSQIDEKYLNYLIDNRSRFLMPIEVNPRLGGDCIWSLVKAVYNVNLFDEHLNICLGYELDVDTLKRKKQHPRYQCVSHLIHPAIDACIASLSIAVDKLINNQKLIELNINRLTGEKFTFRDSCGFFTLILNDYANEIEKKKDNTSN